METKIAAVDREHPDMEKIREAGRIIKDGGLVAFPTETVYGLGGNALDADASRRIYEAKGRPSDNPLIVHIARIEDLARIAAEVPEAARRLADAYWPGPLTIILPKTDAVPRETTGGLDTVAVRFPSHPVAQAFILAAGGFVAAPSANRSGRPSPTSAAHVAEDLYGRIAMILDGGDADIGLESTIVDFTEKTPMILRPGFIGLPALKAVLGEVAVDRSLLGGSEPVRPKAPGMRYRHYAPKAPMVLLSGEEEAVTGEILRRMETAAGEEGRTGVLCCDEHLALYEKKARELGAQDHFLIRGLGSASDEETIAHNLFSALRGFDEDGAARILSETFDTPNLGKAIMNRLKKAAGQNIEYVQ